MIARILAQRLTEQLGKPVVVENKVGGGGTVSAAHVAQSRPDGHTLLLLTSGHAVNETLNRNRGYDLLRDLKPVAEFAAVPYWLVTGPNGPASLPDLLARAKREPMTYASGGPGGLAHLLGEMLRQETRLDLVHVPYRGNAPAITDLLAGRVDMLFDNSGGALEHIRGGRLRALATTSAARLPATPEVPTMKELGFEGFEVSAWLGLAAPAATPAPIVDRLQEEVRRALEDEGVRGKLAAAGAAPAFLGPDRFQVLVREEIARWGRVIKAGNITAD